ncbi:MAG: T9SS type A sorting domain-containing protein [Bacteroidia bacterium]|nr:T9SS type A sorting domain-containing protein [Bacteroidia bacterium]MDW8157933.1 T9SS type A sorting domain-containing protein [Bacteroidia bacterium]
MNFSTNFTNCAGNPGPMIALPSTPASACLLPPPPDANFTVTPNPICVGANATAQLNNPPPVPNPTYTWSFGTDATPATQNGPGPHTVSWSSAANKTVSLTVTSTAGCVTVNTQVVTVINAPTPTITPSPSSFTCPGTNISITGGPAGATVLNWNCDGCFQHPLPNNLGPHNVSWTSTGTKTITLTIQQAGCVATNSIEVTVENISSSFTVDPVQYCPNQVPINPNIFYTGNAPAGSTFLWNFGGGTVSFGTGAGPYAVSWSSIGTKVIQLQITNGACTSPVSTQTVEVKNLDATFTVSPSTVCTNEDVTISAAAYGVPFATYNWSCTNCNSTPTTIGPHVVNWASDNPSIKIISLTISAHGCTPSTHTEMVTVNPGASPLFTLDKTNICSNKTNFNNSVTVQAQDPNASSYTWSCSGCISPPPGTMGPHTLQWSSGGAKVISLTVTAPGCQGATSTQQVNVNEPTASFTASPNPVCVGNIMVLNSTSTGNPVNYTWNCSGCNGGTPISNAPGPHNVNWLSPGVYPVSLVVSDIMGCESAPAMQLATVNTLPTAVITSPLPTITCTNVPLTLQGSGGGTYTWDCNGCTSTPAIGNTAGPYSISWASAIPNVKTITLRVDNGCASPTVSVLVTVNAQANANIIQPGPNVGTCINNDITFQAQSGAAVYTWDCDACTTAPPATEGPFTLSWSNTGVKTVTLKVANPGCPPTTTVSVYVTVNTPPSATITASNVCPSTPTQVSISSIPPPPPTYSWNFGVDADPATGNTAGPFSVSWSSSGTKTITAIVTQPISGGTCSAIITGLVTIHPIPAAPTPVPAGTCGPGTVLLSGTPGANGNTIRWYADATTTTLLSTGLTYTTPFLTTTTTYYISSYNTSTQCEGSRVQIVAHVYTPPAQPTASNVNRCGPGAAIITASMGNPAGTSIRLFSTPTATVPLAMASASPYEITTPVVSVNTTFYLDAFHSQTGCVSSPRVAVVVNVLPPPSLPVAEHASRCEEGVVTFTAYMGLYPGNAIHLYDNNSAQATPIATATAPPYLLTTPSINTTTTFYLSVENTNTSCSSGKLPVIAYVYPYPGIPAVASVTRCGPGVVTFTVTNGSPAGSDILLYTSTTATVPIASDNAAPFTVATGNITTTTTFYIASYNKNTNCESQRVEAVAEVIPSPSASVPNNISRCGPGVLTFTANLSANNGTEVRLFDAPVGGNLLAMANSSPFVITTPTVLTNTTFYVEVFNGVSSCVSSSRVPITATIHPVLPSPLAQNQVRCGAGVVTFNVTNNQGNVARLYSVPSGGTPIATDPSAPFLLTTPVISTTTIFYIEAFNSTTGCSSIRQPVEAKVNPGPPAPMTSDVHRCGPGIVTFTVSANGVNQVRLFTSPNSITPVAVSQTTPFELTSIPITTTTTFFVGGLNQNTGCETARTPVRAVINAVPSAPIVANVARCGVGTVILSPQMGNVPGNKVNLYTVSNGGVPVANSIFEPFEIETPVVTTNTTFYVEVVNTTTNCTSSQRTAVSVNINNIISPPSAANVGRCLAGNITFTVNVSAGSNRVYLYTLAEGGLPIISDDTPPFTLTVPINTTTTFYISQEHATTGCESARLPVVATIYRQPDAPQVSEVRVCGSGIATFTVINPEGNSVRLYTLPSGGEAISSDNTPPYTLATPPITTHSNFYISTISSQGCESGRSLASVIVEPVPPVPQGIDMARCGAGPVTITANAPSNLGVRLYTQMTGGQPIGSDDAFPFTFTINSLNTTTSFYLEAYHPQLNCSSATRSLVIASVVGPIPTPPAVSPVTVCGGGSITFTASMTSIPGDVMNLYNEPTGGIPIAASNTPPYQFTIPFVNTSTTFYLESVLNNNGCRSLSRTPVPVRVVEVPLAPSVLTAYRCGNGVITFTARNQSPSAVIRMFTTSVATNPIATASTAPYLLATPELTSTTIFYFDAWDPITGCTSNRISAIATVSNEAPAAPFASNVSRCGPGIVVFNPTMGTPAGDLLLLYTQAVGGTPIASDNTSPYEVSSPFISLNTTYYLEAVNTITGCTSVTRNPVIANIISNPELPQVVNVSRCGPGMVTLSVLVNPSFGMQIRLYSSPTATEPVNFSTAAPVVIQTPNLTTTTTFYVSAFNLQTGCESGRRSVVATIYPIPGKPVVHPVSVCDGGQITISAEMGVPAARVLRLYTVSVGSTPIASSSTSPYQLLVPNVFTNSTYYVESFDPVSGCISERTPAPVQVNPIPMQPVAQNVSRCGAGIISFTASAVGENIKIRLYNENGTFLTETTTSPFILSTNVTTTSVFYLETVSEFGCQSEKINVIATVYPIPGRPSTSEFSRCGSGSLTITATMGQPQGNAIRLYNVAQGGVHLTFATLPPYTLVTPVVSTHTTFFIESYRTETNCASERVPVVVNILEPPLLANVKSVQRCGPGIVTFTVTNSPSAFSQMRLFTTQTGGNPIHTAPTAPYLLHTPFLNTTTTFFVEHFNPFASCSSERVPVVAIIHSIPQGPVTENITRCGTGSVTFTAIPTANAGQVRLYSDLVSNIILASDNAAPYLLTTPTLVSTTTFYVSIVNVETECESPRVPAVAIIQNTPGIPTAPTVSRCGAGTLIITANVGNPSGDKISLYTQAAGGTPVTVSTSVPHLLVTPEISSTTIFYLEAENTQGNCISNRSTVLAVITPLPQPPVVTNLNALTRCGIGSVTINANIGTADMLNLYTASNAVTPLVSVFTAPFEITTPVVSTTTTFYLEAVNRNQACTSGKQAVIVTVNETPGRPVASDISRCDAGIVTITATMSFPLGNQIRLYSQPTGGNIITSDEAAPYELSLNVNTTGFYYLESVNTLTGCTSSRAPVRVNIIARPGSPFATTVSRCGPGVVTITAMMTQPVGNQLILYDAPTGGNIVSKDISAPFEVVTPVLHSNTMYYLASATENCESPRTSVLVQINTVPAPPIAGDITRCGAGAVTFSASMGLPQGQVISLYTQPVGGGPIATATNTPYLLTVPFVPATTTYYLEAGFLGSNTCTSTRVPVVANISNISARFFVQNDGPVCPGQTVTLRASNISGASYIWSGPNGFSATGPIVSRVIQNTSHAGLYSVVAVVNGCTSEQVVTSVELKPSLTTPQLLINGNNNNLVICEGQSISLTVSNAGIYPPGTTFFFSGPTIAQSREVPHLGFANINKMMEGEYRVYVIVEGCTSALSNTVNLRVQQNPPSPFATNNGVNCTGSGDLRLFATIVSDAVLYEWEGPEGFRAMGQNVVIPAQQVRAGVYSVTVTNAQGCKSTPATTTVVVNNTPSIPAAQVSSPICSGETLVLSVVPQVGVTYAWTGPNGFNVAGNGPVFTRLNITPSDAGTYQLVAISGICSSSVRNYEVVVVDKPRAPVVATNSPICVGSTLQLSILNYQNGLTYRLWGPNGYSATFTSSTLSRNNLKLIDGGIYTIEAVVSNCTSGTSNFSVEVIPAPSTPIAANNGPKCSGETLNLSVLNPVANATYMWSGPNGFSALGIVATRVTSSATEGGIYSVVGIINGCTTEVVTTRAVVTPRPETPQVFNDGPKCFGSVINLTANADPQAQLFWSGPNGFTAQGPFVRKLIEAASDLGVYSVIAVIGNCTSQVGVTNVQASANLAVPTVTNNGPKCTGQSIDLVAAGVAGANYIWRGPNGFTASGANVRLNNVSPTMIGLYSVTAYINNCSSEIATTFVQVNPTPERPQIFSNQVNCAGQNLVLTAEGVRGATYIWAGPNGFVATGSNVNRLLTSHLDGGEYSVIAVVNGCTSAPAVLSISVGTASNPTPPTLISNAPVCVGQTLVLTASGSPSAVYQWVGPNGFTATGATITRAISSLLEAGEYRVVVNDGACGSTAATITVAVVSPPATPVIVGRNSYCVGETINLAASTSSTSANLNYLWSGPNGFISTAQQVTITNAMVNHAGVYSLIALNGSCSSRVATISLQVNTTPTLDFVSNNGPVCVGSQLMLSAASTPGAIYFWTGPNGYTSTQQNPVITNVQLGQAGVYQAYVVVGNCTSAVASTNVVVNRAPAAPVVNVNSPVCVGNPIELFANPVPGATYNWQGPNGFFSTQQNPTISNANLQNSGTYSLSIVLGGCTSSTTTARVVVNPLPTASFVEGGSTVCRGSSANIVIRLTGTGPWQINYTENGAAQTPLFVGNAASVTPFDYTLTVTPSNNINYVLTEVVDGVGCRNRINSSYRLAVNTCDGRCPAPVALQPRQITANSAVLNWATSLNAVCYIIQYGPLSVDPATWSQSLVPHPATSINLTNLMPGMNYGARILANCGECSFRGTAISDPSSLITFTTALAKLEGTSRGSVVIYPNPTESGVFVALRNSYSENAYLELFSVGGQLLQKRQITSQSEEYIDMASLPSGLYTLKVTQGQEVWVEKILKR